MSDGLTDAYKGTYFKDRSKLVKKLSQLNNKKMERKEVYRIIDNERKYQDTVRRRNENETRKDDQKSVADFILYMEHTLNKAKTAIYTLNETEALALIRKITALGVAAGESFGFPER